MGFDSKLETSGLIIKVVLCAILGIIMLYIAYNMFFVLIYGLEEFCKSRGSIGELVCIILPRILS